MGFVAGILGGLLGIGGGALIVPGLVFFLNFKQHRAHGTSLAAVLLLSLTSVIMYTRQGNIDWRLAAEMAAGGVTGAMIGARVVKRIKGTVLRRVFSVFLILVGVRMIWNGFGGDGAPQSAAQLAALHGAAWGTLVALGTGVMTGFTSALLGVGGGIVMVPAMVMLLSIPQHVAQGVSLAAMLPTALTGMLMHHKMGNVDFKVAKFVGLGAVFGAVLGALLAGRLDAHALKLGFGIFLIVIATLMVLKKREGAQAEASR